MITLINGSIQTPTQWIESGYITIESGIIQEIGIYSNQEGIDCSGMTLLPGFIDMHVHGTNGCDFMDASHESIQSILDQLLKEGVTSCLATTMTDSVDNILKALRALGSFQSNKGSKLLGIHLEGPFLNKLFKGAQDPQYIIEGSLKLFDEFQEASNHRIKMVTLAPEVQSDAFLQGLQHRGILVSMGHSSATHSEVEHAMKFGVKRVTHCYNAMSPLHHREIGLVGSALLHDDLTVEIICDHFHVSKEAIQLVSKCKPTTSIELVTDSIRAKNMPDGLYELGGQHIQLVNGVPLLGNQLAGSVLTMSKAVRHFKEDTLSSWQDIANVTSSNQAKELGIHTKVGSMCVGMNADIVGLDAMYNVVFTYQSEHNG
jgi:N-acetylglucosamine-6-phosphate deacetylase